MSSFSFSIRDDVDEKDDETVEFRLDGMICSSIVLADFIVWSEGYSWILNETLVELVFSLHQRYIYISVLQEKQRGVRYIS